MAYDPELATRLAKEVKRELKAMERKKQSWCGMTRWFLWSAAARHGIVEMIDQQRAHWGGASGIKARKGHKRTLNQAWRRVFAD